MAVPMTRRARRGVLAGAAIIVVILSMTALAWACTALATLDLAPASAPAGTLVTGTGSGFSASPLDTPVQIRWNGQSGPVLASVRPDLLGNGEVTFQAQIPDVAPGWYVVVATQYNVVGRPVAGTPARAAFQVVAN